MVTLDQFKRAFSNRITVDSGSATSALPGLSEQKAAPAPHSGPAIDRLRDFVAQSPENAPMPNPYKKDGARVPDFVLMGSILDWNAKKKGGFNRLWYLVDRNGGVVRRGTMGTVNQDCEDILHDVVDIVTLDQEWNRKVGEVWDAIKVARKDIEQLRDVLPAITSRMDTDSDFFQRIDNYLNALDEPQSAVTAITAAASDLKEAEADLRVAVTDLQIEKAREELKVKNEELEQLKKDIEETKKIYKTTIEIVKQVASMDWGGLANRALDYLEDYAIDSIVNDKYGEELKRLQQELAKANAKLKGLTTQKLVDAIEARARGVESATTRLAIAQKGLSGAIKKLHRYRADAQNEMNDSKATRVAGKIFGQHGEQMRTIASARALCDRFSKMSADLAQGVMMVSADLNTVVNDLEMPAESDPAWGSARMAAQYNRDNLVTWADHSLKGRQNECSKVRKWLDENGAKGPTAPFEEAMELIHQALSKAVPPPRRS